jgi:tRNA threonylcarbamoyladenosine modification (KEOPS) complex  Pcc1 subunit
LDEAEIDRIAEMVLRRIHIRIEADAISQLRDMLNSLWQ